MSRFKFRAWDKRLSKMVTDFVLAPTSPTWAPFRIHKNEEANKLLNKLDRKNGDPFGGDYTMTDWGDWYAIEEYTVMQFIGARDKDGKEIFEGDIVRTSEAGWIGKVVYSDDHGVFMCKDNVGGFSSFIAWEETEVLGNIYEQPDIMT